MPDCGELTVVERRHAGCGLLQKALIGLFCVTILLDDDSSEAGHGSVTASFRDHSILFMAAGQVSIELDIIQKFREVHASGIELHIRFLRPEKETRRIQSLGIEIREYGIDQLLHVAVQGGVRHAINGKQNMELRSCGLPVFLTLIKTAVVDCDADTGKGLKHICRCYPVL